MDDANPIKIAMSRIESLGRAARCSEFLSPAVTLTFMDSGECFEGPEEIEELFRNLHNRLFAASTHVRATPTAACTVVLEAHFSGHHIQEFAGLHPSGKQVQSNCALAYDIDDGTISAIRAYWNLDALILLATAGRARPAVARRMSDVTC